MNTRVDSIVFPGVQTMMRVDSGDCANLD